jgi:predicted ester cyclase
MATPSPKEIAIQWFEEVWNQRSREAIHKLMAADAVGHLEGGLVVNGPEGFTAFHDQLLAALPDIKIRILHAVGDDTQAAVHWESVSTHKGQFLDKAPTNKVIQFTGMTYVHVRNGQIVEGWDAFNHGALMAAMS